VKFNKKKKFEHYNSNTDICTVQYTVYINSKNIKKGVIPHTNSRRKLIYMSETVNFQRYRIYGKKIRFFLFQKSFKLF